MHEDAWNLKMETKEIGKILRFHDLDKGQVISWNSMCQYKK